MMIARTTTQGLQGRADDAVSVRNARMRAAQQARPAKVVRVLLVLDVYVVAASAAVALYRPQLLYFQPRVSAGLLVGAVALAVVRPFWLQRHWSLLSLLGGSVLLALGLIAVVNALALEQAMGESLIGGARLLFPILLFSIGAASGSAAVESWIFDRYLWHARAAYSLLVGVLVVRLIVSGRPTLLPVGYGYSVILLGAALVPRSQSTVVRTFDLVLCVTGAVLSLKRGALATLLIVVIMLTLQGVLYGRMGPASKLSLARLRVFGRGALALVLLAVAVAVAPPVRAVVINRVTIVTDAYIGDGAFDRSIETRMSETDLGFQMYEEGSAASRIFGLGPGVRFPKRDDTTGALHNSYMTGLVLGGVIWVTVVSFGLLLALVRSRRSWIFPVLVALCVAGVSGNILLGATLPLLAGVWARDAKRTLEGAG